MMTHEQFSAQNKPQESQKTIIKEDFEERKIPFFLQARTFPEALPLEIKAKPYPCKRWNVIEDYLSLKNPQSDCEKRFEDCWNYSKQDTKRIFQKYGALGAFFMEREKMGFLKIETKRLFKRILFNLLKMDHDYLAQNKDISVVIYDRPETCSRLSLRNKENEEQIIFLYFNKKESNCEDFPGFMILIKDDKNNEGNKKTELQTLKNYLVYLAKERDFPYVYGLVANMNSMKFVKFSTEEQQFYESDEFYLSVQEDHIKSSNHLKNMYRIMFYIIEENLKQVNLIQ